MSSDEFSDAEDSAPWPGVKQADNQFSAVEDVSPDDSEFAVADDVQSHVFSGSPSPSGSVTLRPDSDCPDKYKSNGEAILKCLSLIAMQSNNRELQEALLSGWRGLKAMELYGVLEFAIDQDSNRHGLTNHCGPHSQLWPILAVGCICQQEAWCHDRRRQECEEDELQQCQFQVK